MKRPGVVKAYLLDVEGVLVADKSYRALPGALDWMTRLQLRGIPFCLVSNNTTLRPDAQLALLGRAGFDLMEENLLGALDCGVRWLTERGLRRILWLGRPDLDDFWSDHGFEPTDGAQADVVVLGADPDFSTSRLEGAIPPLVDRDARLLCLNRNPFFVDADGRRRPGPGAWAAALEAIAGSDRIVTVGKPAERIYHDGLKRVGAAPSDTLFISDDPRTDLVTAGRLGLRTAFVLSGKYSDHVVLGELEQNEWPDQICAGLADIELPEEESF